VTFKELWFLDNPVETGIGMCRFVKVREYEKILMLSSILQLGKLKAIQFVKENNIGTIGIDEAISLLNEMSFIEIIRSVEWLGLLEGYNNLFDFCFINKGSFDLVKTDEELDFYVKLIKDMNNIAFEKPCLNPELEYFNKLEQIAKERKGEVITFKSMVMNVGLYKDNVLDISIYSLHEYFTTISNNKNYNTGTLYQTVSAEKMKITPWYADLSVEKTKLDETDKKFIGSHLNMVKDNPEQKGIISNIDNHKDNHK